MARAKYDFDEKKIARFEKEGRGQGTLAAYRPWLKINEVPSQGRSHRVLGLTTSRIHHFLSDIECNLFLLLDWQKSVFDIREQFPLDREITMAIATDRGIPHPVDRLSKTPLVMTTDFLVTVVKDGKQGERAYAVKPAKALDDERTVLKLEIERQYWTKKGVNWSIVTEQDIPLTYVKNVQWLHGQSDYPTFEPNVGVTVSALLSELTFKLGSAVGVSIGVVTNEFDTQKGLARGTSLKLTRFLLASGMLFVDMHQEIGPQMSAEFVILPDEIKVRRA